MCRRLIINAGIVKTACRVSEDEYIVINTRDWVFNDDSLSALNSNAGSARNPSCLPE
jgi:deoxycytidylate deaminase